MTTLSIYLFGSVQVVRDKHTPVTLRPTAKAVLAFLLLQQQRSPYRMGHRREALANHFWGNQDEKNARRCLSTTLWRLRRELEKDEIPRGTYLVTTPVGEVSFNFGSDHWLDVVAFEERVNVGMRSTVTEMSPADALALEEAHNLYTGELLEDCYGDWVLRERERLNLLYLNSLARLMRYHEHHDDYERSLICGQKILAVDPLREQVHRHIMRLYTKSGQRALAVQQYEYCRQILAAELDIEPMIETQALYKEIMSSNGIRTREAPSDTRRPKTLQQALQQLRTATRNLDQAQAQLYQAKLIVSRFAELRYAEDTLVEVDGSGKHRD
jgi:DNA-binding SARP family transcriptional activator